MVGTKFALKDVSTFWYSGGLGDDTIYGATKDSDGGLLAKDNTRIRQILKETLSNTRVQSQNMIYNYTRWKWKCN